MTTTEQAARALWEHDNAEGTTAEWREMAWNDMGGSEPSQERVEYMLRADALHRLGHLTNEAPATDTEAAEVEWRLRWTPEFAVGAVGPPYTTCEGEEKARRLLVLGNGSFETIESRTVTPWREVSR